MNVVDDHISVGQCKLSGVLVGSLSNSTSTIFVDESALEHIRQTLTEKIETVSAGIITSGVFSYALAAIPGGVEFQYDVPGDPLQVDPLTFGNWTDSYKQVGQGLQFITTCSPIFDLVYRAGELVYESYVTSLTRVHDQLRSWVQQLRLIASLIARIWRSGKGTSSIVSVFVQEASWYHQHGAHPPTVAAKAISGRFAAKLRRACFRPLPASP